MNGGLAGVPVAVHAEPQLNNVTVRQLQAQRRSEKDGEAVLKPVV